MLRHASHFYLNFDVFIAGSKGDKKETGDMLSGLENSS